MPPIVSTSLSKTHLLWISCWILLSRSAEGRQTYDILLQESRESSLETKLSSPFGYTFECNGRTIVVQTDGIYRLDGFSRDEVSDDEKEGYLGGGPPSLKKLDNNAKEWPVRSGDKVLHGVEWERKCFILVSTQEGNYSTVYTLHGESMVPIFRQQIRNYGFSTSAKFFIFQKNLYLTITNDNAVHSLTICPLFRWAGTYMDEIHAIQTRGAVAVETFIVQSKQYIAIAQSQDSSGNYEIGTQILGLDEKEDLEKVQLLWSSKPVSLHYFEVQQEHYLIIGQANEASLVYLFEGIDFIPTQALESYFGPNLFMDSFLQPDKRPILVAATGSTMHFYSWSNTFGSLILNTNASALNFKRSAQIVSMKFMRVASSQLVAVIVILESSSVGSSSNLGRPILKILPVTFRNKPVEASLVRETESGLSKCLMEISRKLEEDEKDLPMLMETIKEILLKDATVNYDGVIRLDKSLTSKEEVTAVRTINVIPKGFEKHEALSTPSHLLATVTGEATRLKEVQSRLPDILMRNEEGSITGDYDFASLEVGVLTAPQSNLQLKVLNEIKLEDIENYALRKKTESSQVVTGRWTITNFEAPTIEIPTEVSYPNVSNFLLRNKCGNKYSSEYPQTIEGQNAVFHKSVNFLDGIAIQPEAIVNGVLISDMVLKNGPVKVIRGYKHSQNLDGEDGFTFTFVNDQNFSNWYESILHKDGPPQRSTGKKTLSAPQGTTKIGNFIPKILNGHDWNRFHDGILLNKGDQLIHRQLKFERLDVDVLEANHIGDVTFQYLLSSNGTSEITSNITVNTLTVQSDLTVNTVNDLRLPEIAVLKNEDAVIEGPVELENFKVKGDVTLDDFIEIAGKDISEIAKQRRKQIYHSPPNRPVQFSAPVISQDLSTPILNEQVLDHYQDRFWSRKDDISIEDPLEFKGRTLRVMENFKTDSLNGMAVESDFVVLGEASDPILGSLNFVGDVVVEGDVHQTHKRTLNDIDFSELENDIVKAGDDSVIRGIKRFTAPLIASGGANVENLNGVQIPGDLVFLDNLDATQVILGSKIFKNHVKIKNLLTSKDINVDGTVNGVNMRHLHQTTVYSNHPAIVHGDLVFNEFVFAKNLSIRHHLNKIDLADLFRNAIHLGRKETISFPLKLNGELDVQGEGDVDSINGIPVKEYLSRVVLSKDEAPPYRINGTKTFLNLTIFSDLVCDRLNGISLFNLSTNSLSRTKSQTITAVYTIESLTILDNLNVVQVDGINTDNFIHVNNGDEECEVNGDVVFSSDVTVHGKLSVGTLHGYNISHLRDDQHGVDIVDRNFKEVEVMGNLEWSNNRKDIRGISHFFDNAVTLDGDQEITGHVTFADGFHAEDLQAQAQWIEDVDLSRILEDAIKFDDINLIFQGNNKFLKPLTLDSGLEVGQKLKTDSVNGVSLHKLNKFIVRQGEHGGPIYGTKHFPTGLRTEELQFKNLNNKGDYSWLLTLNDERKIDHAEFHKSVVVSNDLTYNTPKGFDLGHLLDNRVTRDGEQSLHGDYTVESLDVDQDCNVESVNGIKLSDIYLTNATGSKQEFDGTKVFHEGLSIDGDLFTHNLNNYDFHLLHKDIYRKHQPEEIHQSVIFKKPVTIERSLEVEDSVNGHPIKGLDKAIHKTLEGIESRALEEVAYEPSASAEKLALIEETKERLEEPPYWLEYLRLKQNWTALGPQSRVEFTITRDRIVVALHEYTVPDVYNTNYEDSPDEVSYPERPKHGAYSASSPLPQGCLCNTVRFLDIVKSQVTASRTRVSKCTNAFVVSSQLGHVYTVLDNTVSYNKTCYAHDEDENLTITRASDTVEHVIMVVPSKGYLSDVKVFSANHKDYLILSYYFSSEKKSHNSSTFIYRVDKSTVTFVQALPSYGPLRIALTAVQGDWILAIANNRDPKTDAYLTQSSIYRWSSSSQRFDQVRNVQTNGAVDVTFIDAQDRAGLHYKGWLNFIAFAQSGISGNGEVMILKYDPERQNYYSEQFLRTNWSVTAIDFVCIQENCYLILVVPQEGVHFFEYRYVEGFRHSFTVPLIGVKDIAAFSWGDNRERLLFPIASSKTSLLAEGVIAGIVNNQFYYSHERDEYGDPYENTSTEIELSRLEEQYK